MNDIRKPIKTLIDVLASHDVPLSFLFGAGTSSAVMIKSDLELGTETSLIPAVGILTSDCEKFVLQQDQLGEKFGKAWEEISNEANEVVGRKDIEAVLSRVRQKRDAIVNTNIHGLTPDQLGLLEGLICKFIATKVAPPESRIPKEIPHDLLARWIKALGRKRPIEIFTTNYDILIERSLEKIRIPIFDGFVGSYKPYFDASLFDRDQAEISISWLRLWKIHGSVAWHLGVSDGNQFIYRGEVSDQGQMILPSHYKYDESRKMPYRAMQDRLGRILDIAGSAMITAGYSFSDEHINETILSHSDRSNAMVIALMYEELSEDSVVIKLSDNRPNFVVIGPTSGRYRGVFSEWGPDSLEDCATDPLLQCLTSEFHRVHIGDFNNFTALLAGLADSGATE